MTRRIGTDIFPYARCDEILQEIDELRLTGYQATHARVQLLRGPSGVGKSAIVQKYAAQHPAKQTDDGWFRPVVLATASKGLTKPLAEELLRSLEDHKPSRGTENEMMARVQAHLREQKTQLIIFDEVQDAMRGDLSEHADFYKRVLNWSVCPVLLVGAPHAVELLKASEYLRGRSRPTIDLKAFDWFDPDQQTTYRRILKTIQRDVLRKDIESVDLHSIPVASALNYATWGTMRRLTRLLEHAERLAIKSRMKRLDRDVLAAAYQAFLNQEPDDAPRRANPFVQDLPKQWQPMSC
jgi:hypothetical protein